MPVGTPGTGTFRCSSTCSSVQQNHKIFGSVISSTGISVHQVNVVHLFVWVYKYWLLYCSTTSWNFIITTTINLDNDEDIDIMIAFYKVFFRYLSLSYDCSTRFLKKITKNEELWKQSTTKQCCDAKWRWRFFGWLWWLVVVY